MAAAYIKVFIIDFSSPIAGLRVSQRVHSKHPPLHYLGDPYKTVEPKQTSRLT